MTSSLYDREVERDDRLVTRSLKIVVAGGLLLKCESQTSLKPGTSSGSLR